MQARSLAGSDLLRATSRVLAIAVSLAVLAIGASGYLNGGALRGIEYWWIATLGLAILPFGLGLWTRWQSAGLMAALFLAGFAAQLALKDPLWFQHFRLSAGGLSPAMLAAVGAQGVVAAAYLLRNGGLGHLGRIGRAMGWSRLALLAFVLVVASKAAMDFIASDNPSRYVKQLAIALAFLGCNLLALAAFAVALPGPALSTAVGRIAPLVAPPGADTGATPAGRSLPWLAALFVLVICAMISLWSFDGVPHLDGIVYLFHARYFAEGQLSVPVPAVVEAFGHYLMDANGNRWFSVNLPGWPAALVPAIWSGVPWLLNPVLAAICVVLLHRFVRTATDRRTADLVVMLLAVSPWFLSISSTYLLHTFTAALVLGAWVLLQKSREAPSFLLPFLAGALMGWLFLSRPLEGVYMGVLTGLWTLGFLTDRRQWRTVVMYGLGCIAVGILLFAYNTALTGSPMTLPMTVYLDAFWGPGANAIGFGPDRGPPDWGNVDVFPGHTPAEALINFQQSLYELNFDLFGWAGASLFFALVFLIWGRWSRLAAAMAVITGVTVLLYALYWYVGGFYAGPRYWFMALIPMLLFSALGIREFVARMHALYPHGQAAERITALLLMLGVTSIAVFESWLAFNKYPDINNYHADYLDLSRRAELRNALVFVHIEKPERYGSAFWLNDFSDDADTPLFAVDLGTEVNRKVAAAYPDRRIFLVEGRSERYPHATVVAGPIGIDDLK